MPPGHFKEQEGSFLPSRGESGDSVGWVCLPSGGRFLRKTHKINAKAKPGDGLLFSTGPIRQPAGGARQSDNRPAIEAPLLVEEESQCFSCECQEYGWAFFRTAESKSNLTGKVTRGPCEAGARSAGERVEWSL